MGVCTSKNKKVPQHGSNSQLFPEKKTFNETLAAGSKNKPKIQIAPGSVHRGMESPNTSWKRARSQDYVAYGDVDSDSDGDHDTPIEFPKRRHSLSPRNIDAEEEAKRRKYQAEHGKKNSIVKHIESTRKLQEKQNDYKMRKRLGTINLDRPQNVIYLPRGGTVVNTPVGPIQFGLPPETIKDSINLGLTLPVHFVLPKQRFNLQSGINVAEFEFPSYFNFFVLRKKTNLIIAKEVEPLIRTIFQETLLGPEKIEEPETFSEEVPQEAYPDMAAECAHFRKNPFNPSSDLSTDTILSFTHFENGVAELEKGITIVDNDDEFIVKQNDTILATVPAYVVVTSPEVADRKEDIPFVPPAFGITMLGNSHGFDSKGTTTGFVIWMNRRGIMVDPPPHAGSILKEQGIPSRLIRGIILTHCHADHDAGTFQKILEEGRVILYTTPLILNSFLRKYSAISGLTKEFLEKLFEFRPVVIGERTSVYGGELQFFYSLHSIPCVGFMAFCRGRSMVYSGDTFNDPEGINRLYEQKVLSAGRRDKLLNFPWDCDAILHEAGVPPIHTPMKTLMNLPPDVKKRLYVVHVAQKDIPPDSGLKSAKMGPLNTIIIHNDTDEDFQALEVLDLMGSMDIFEELPIQRSVEMLQAARIVRYSAGHTLIEQGSSGSTMYVVMMGTVNVYVNGNMLKKLTVGDHFGEMSIVTGQARTATIVAATETELLEFDGPEFLYLVRDTKIIERLQHLGAMQKERSWQVFEDNSVLGSLSSTQKTHLQSYLQKHDCSSGDTIWEAQDKARFVIIVESGSFVFYGATSQQPFRRGAFVGEVHAILHNQILSTTLICSESGSFYYVSKKNLLKFFDDYPGVQIYFQDRRFVE